MIRPLRALQAADHDALELESVVAALSAQFAVKTGPGQLVRRRQLETFDRRLHGAGLTLEHRLAAGQDMAGPDAWERLMLRQRDGLSTVVVPVAGVRWPATLALLPAGSVRDAIAPVIGIRALMVASDELRRMRLLDLRNGDGKVVARVELDEPAPRAAKAATPAMAAPSRLFVRRMRGYDDQARRAERLLVDLGLRAVDGEGEGRRPRPAPKPAGMDRAAPARVLLQAALSDFLATMRENLPGLLDDVDTEFLHDFRVAVRRTRATLKLGRPALPDEMRITWEPAFKWLGDLTTPVRDLDVYELDLPAMSHWLATSDPADLEPLATHLGSRRTAARNELVSSLTSARFQHMVTQWAEDLARLVETPEGAGREHLSAGQLADRSLSWAYRRVVRDGAMIEAGSPATELHALRKRCKELRYALEIFAPLIDRRARRQAVADLKDLQDVLGRFQDSEVQRRALRAFAGEMMEQGATAGAVLAMGELIGHLDVEQDRARRQFDVAFSRFERPSSLQKMDRPGGQS